MRRLVLILPFALLAVSCVLLDREVIDAPPKRDEAALARWWDATVDRLPPDFLAAYLEVSEAHLHAGTSATYVDSFTGITMVAKYHSEFRLPAPPPGHVLAKIREKLSGSEPGEGPDASSAVRG